MTIRLLAIPRKPEIRKLIHWFRQEIVQETPRRKIKSCSVPFPMCRSFIHLVKNFWFTRTSSPSAWQTLPYRFWNKYIPNVFFRFSRQEAYFKIFIVILYIFFGYLFRELDSKIFLENIWDLVKDCCAMMYLFRGLSRCLIWNNFYKKYIYIFIVLFLYVFLCMCSLLLGFVSVWQIRQKMLWRKARIWSLILKMPSFLVVWKTVASMRNQLTRLKLNVRPFLVERCNFVHCLLSWKQENNSIKLILIL